MSSKEERKPDHESKFSDSASGSFDDEPEPKPERSSEKSAPAPEKAKPSDGKPTPFGRPPVPEGYVPATAPTYYGSNGYMYPIRRSEGVPGAILINNELFEPEKDFSSKDLENQSFKGPKKGRGAYASVCVLDPILTIEHRDKEYHVAVNFHLETTILGYNTQKRSACFPLVKKISAVLTNFQQ